MITIHKTISLALTFSVLVFCHCQYKHMYQEGYHENTIFKQLTWCFFMSRVVSCNFNCKSYGDEFRSWLVSSNEHRRLHKKNLWQFIVSIFKHFSFYLSNSSCSNVVQMSFMQKVNSWSLLRCGRSIENRSRRTTHAFLIDPSFNWSTK